MEILLTVVVLLVIGGAFLVTYLRYLKGVAVERWMLVLDLLRIRLDKIPNLIETVRRFVPDEKFDALLELRSACWPLDISGKNKVAAELEISDKLGAIWGLVKKNAEMGRDTNFLELRMEFKDISRNIEEALEAYNGCDPRGKLTW